MQVNATDIFRVGLGGASGGSRKAGIAGNVEGAGSRGVQDVVAISDLAKQMQAKATQADQAGFVAKTVPSPSTKEPVKLADALTGEVAKVFGFLNDDAKAKLEAGVASGKVSVKEVEEGLKFLANQEVAIGVQRSRVRSAAEIETSKKMRDLADLADQYGKESGAILGKIDELSRKWQLGEVTDEQYNAQSAKLMSEYNAVSDSEKYKDIYGKLDAARTENMKMLFEGLQKDLGGPQNEMQWLGAMEKLDAIGFDVHRNRQSFKSYAASQETPTMFRADAA